MIKYKWTMNISPNRGVDIISIYYHMEHLKLVLEGYKWFIVDGVKEYSKNKYTMTADNRTRIFIKDEQGEQIFDEHGNPFSIGELDAWLSKYHSILEDDILLAIQKRENLI